MLFRSEENETFSAATLKTNNMCLSATTGTKLVVKNVKIETTGKTSAVLYFNQAYGTVENAVISLTSTYTLSTNALSSIGSSEGESTVTAVSYTHLADVDGGKTPATPRAIKLPLKPSTKR